MSPLQDCYTALRDTLGERWTFAFIMCCVGWARVLLNAAWYYAVEVPDRLRRYRILPDRKVDQTLRKQAMRDDIIDAVLISPIFLPAVFGFELWLNPAIVSPTLPALSTMLWQMVLCVAVEDTVLYWTHRMIHHRRLYKDVHKQHHEFHVTTCWAATYATGSEKMTAHMLPAVVGAWLCNAHVVTRALYTLILVVDSFVGHAGYHLPYQPFTSALRHNYHHSHNVGTYGLKFPFWDWVCGTDVAFRKWEAEWLEGFRQRDGIRGGTQNRRWRM